MLNTSVQLTSQIKPKKFLQELITKFNLIESLKNKWLLELILSILVLVLVGKHHLLSL